MLLSEEVRAHSDSDVDSITGDERSSRVYVLGAAPTHAARLNLEKSLGVISDDAPPDQKPTLHRSRVLASWLWRWKPGWTNCQLAQIVLTDRPSSLALFIDESSMVDLRTWHELFETLLGLLEELPFLRARCVLFSRLKEDFYGSCTSNARTRCKCYGLDRRVRCSSTMAPCIENITQKCA